MQQTDIHPKNPLHIPVLLVNVLEDLALKGEEKFLDCTLGLGGHSESILNSARECQLCGLDRDEQALRLAMERLSPFGERVHLFHLPFAEFAKALSDLGWPGVDAVLLDLGVSSMQLDDAARGFSFRLPGPLDMRMDQAGGGKSAREFVNRASFAELRDCFATLGEEPQAGKIARRIIEARQREPFETTEGLAEVIRLAYPPAWRRTARRHPATRCFQALRMAINDELGQLKYFLAHIWEFLNPGGRLVVISFHSLEDRMVKHAMRAWAMEGNAILAHKKPLVPGDKEIAANPRASSAKLRCAVKLGLD